jgi:two-component system sensor histidine kinase FlrB
LSNLVNNSLQAIPHGAVLELRTEISDSGEITLRLRDNGPGIPAEARARIFDPFFTTRPGGTGLGLAVVQATLRAHHGSIRLDTPREGGCEFVLHLPNALAVADLPSGECLNYLTTAVASRPAVCGIN